MQTSKQIEEKIIAGASKIDAIIELAKEEERELTAVEQKAVTAFHGEGDEVGEFGKLEAEKAQAEKIEARQKMIAERMKGRIEQQQDDMSGGPEKVVAVPARAKRHSTLKAFRGNEAQKDAYISGHQIAATLFGNRHSAKWLDDHGITAAMSTDDNTKGGLFVPVEMETAIIRLVEEYGVFRSGAMTSTMTSDRKIHPVRVSGLQAYPVSETNTGNQGSNTGTTSDPVWTPIELIARKWKVITRMSDELNEDSLIQVADQLAVEAALAFAISEDQSGFLGDGTSTYHSITGLKSSLLAGSVYTATTGNTSFATLDLADFENMVGKLPDYPGMMPAWHITKEGFYASMARLINAGAGSSADIMNGPQPMFMGLPVIFNQVTNKTLTAQTSTRLFYLGDLAMAAVFGDRRDVTVSLSDQRYWDEDQIGLKWTERFDINVHSTGTATEAGAIIALETPGS